MEKEDIVVERERFQLRKPFFDTTDRTFDGTNRDRMYLLKERRATLAVGDVENDPRSTSSRHNEVALRVADTRSFVDIQGSFGDHAFAVKGGFLPATAMFSLEHLCAMRFDPSPVWRCDVPTYERTRDSRQVFVVSPDPLGNMFGRLIVHEIRFDGFLEFGMQCDRTPLGTGVLPFGVCALMCVCGIVRSSFSRERIELIPHRARYDTDCFTDLLQCVFLPLQYLDLVSVSFREMRTVFLFSFAHSTQINSNSKDDLPEDSSRSVGSCRNLAARGSGRARRVRTRHRGEAHRRVCFEPK